MSNIMYHFESIVVRTSNSAFASSLPHVCHTYVAARGSSPPRPKPNGKKTGQHQAQIGSQVLNHWRPEAAVTAACLGFPQSPSPSQSSASLPGKEFQGLKERSSTCEAGSRTWRGREGGVRAQAHVWRPRSNEFIVLN